MFEVQLDYGDVLIRPSKSSLGSRSEVDLVMPEHNVVPIMAANMDGVGTFAMAEELSKHGIITCLVKSYGAWDIIDWVIEKGQFIDSNLWVYSMGVSYEEMLKLDYVMLNSIVRENIKTICIDVANGYMDKFMDRCKMVRDKYPDVKIIAGNVVTPERTRSLILAGVDIVKVGIGPGSVCTTRIQTGVGYPQFSAVMDCVEAAYEAGGMIIADGGCNTAGDVAKAFAVGADFVMLGGMLAGTDQGGGEVISKLFKTGEVQERMTIKFGEPDVIRTYEDIVEVKKFVEFYGMSSETANEKHFGGTKGYRSSEGRTALIEYKGDVGNIVSDILGGVRSACTYVGAANLKELRQKARFVRCTNTHNRINEKNTIGK